MFGIQRMIIVRGDEMRQGDEPLRGNRVMECGVDGKDNAKQEGRWKAQ